MISKTHNEKKFRGHIFKLLSSENMTKHISLQYMCKKCTMRIIVHNSIVKTSKLRMTIWFPYKWSMDSEILNNWMGAYADTWNYSNNPIPFCGEMEMDDALS